MTKLSLVFLTLVCVVSQVISSSPNIHRDKRQENPVNPGAFFSFLGQQDIMKNFTQKLSGDNKEVRLFDLKLNI